jgi:hypothetical protein
MRCAHDGRARTVGEDGLAVAVLALLQPVHQLVHRRHLHQHHDDVVLLRAVSIHASTHASTAYMYLRARIHRRAAGVRVAVDVHHLDAVRARELDRAAEVGGRRGARLLLQALRVRGERRPVHADLARRRELDRRLLRGCAVRARGVVRRRRAVQAQLVFWAAGAPVSTASGGGAGGGLPRALELRLLVVREREGEDRLPSVAAVVRLWRAAAVSAGVWRAEKRRGAVPGPSTTGDTI